MRELILILNLKANSFLKSVFQRKWDAFLKNFSSVFIFGGFALGIFLLTRGTTSYLLQQAHIGHFLFHRFLSMLLYVFFITVNLGNMIVCYATLYKSQEVNFLMALPLSHTKIFLIKFVDNFFYSSTTLSLVGFSVLLGYGSYFDLPWYFYFFTMFFVFMPFMLIAGIIAVILLMSLITVASRIGMRWLIGTIVVVYLTAIYVYFKVTNPVQLVEEVMKHYPNVNEYFGYLDPPLVHYLPNHWVTEFLYWSISGEHARAVPYFSLLFLTMLGLIVFAGLLAHRYYYKSWLASGELQVMKESEGGQAKTHFVAFGRDSFLKPQTEVLIKRDIVLFFRDPSQWLHLMLMLILLVIFLISVGNLDLKPTQPLMQAITLSVVFLFNGFLTASIALRFVFPAVSLESDVFWCVRSSPLSMNKLYWYKFLVSFVSVLCIAELLSIASVGLLRDNLLLVQVGAVCTLFVTLALISLNMGAGAYFATFKEKNPIRVASSQGASLTFLGSMLYLTAVTLILIIPLNRYFELLILRGISHSSWAYSPLMAIGALSLLVFATFTSIGLKAIKRDL